MNTHRNIFFGIQAGEFYGKDPGHAAGNPAPLPVTAERTPQTLRAAQRRAASSKTACVPKARTDPIIINLDPEDDDSVPPKGSGGAVTPPTEEDLRKMPSLARSGHITRPWDASAVWAYVHRDAVQKSHPNAGLADIGVHLSEDWTKLSEEHRKSYYGAADKPRAMLGQPFPQHECHFHRKRGRENLIPRNVASQAAEKQLVLQSSLSISNAVCPAESHLIHPRMYSVLPIVPHPVGYYPYPLFYPHHPTGLHSWAHQPRVFHGHPATCSFVHGEINHHHSCLPRGTAAPTVVATMQQNLQLCNTSQQVPSGSTASPGNPGKPDFVSAKEQPSNRDINHAGSLEEDIDVVGL